MFRASLIQWYTLVYIGTNWYNLREGGVRGPPKFFWKLDFELGMELLGYPRPQYANIFLSFWGPRPFGVIMASWPNMGAKDMGAEKSLETMVVGALRIGLSQGSLFLKSDEKWRSYVPKCSVQYHTQGLKGQWNVQNSAKFHYFSMTLGLFDRYAPIGYNIQRAAQKLVKIDWEGK